MFSKIIHRQVLAVASLRYVYLLVLMCDFVFQRATMSQQQAFRSPFAKLIQVQVQVQVVAVRLAQLTIRFFSLTERD